MSRFLKFGMIAFALSLLMGTLHSCEEVKGVPEEYPVKEKTVLVYMIANNDLSGNAVSNLADLKKGFIPQKEDGNVVVYYHVPNKNPYLFNIVKGADGAVKVDTAYVFPARNSATTASLASAMNVTATLFPAEETGLILWSHGTGWLPTGFYEKPVEDKLEPISENAPSAVEDLPYYNVKMSRDGASGGGVRSFGSDSGKEIDLKDLAAALPYKVSFIIFDACLMGGIEVMYELKDSTDYILASPTEIMAAGFPYSEIMEPIFAEPTDLESVAMSYYLAYKNALPSTNFGTISLVKTSELENVAEITSEIFSSNRAKIPVVRVGDLQRYYTMNKHWFYDFSHFVEKIATPEQYEEFTQALNKAVVYKAATDRFFDIDINPETFSGVSSYVPVPYNTTLANYYKDLKWNKATGLFE